MKTFHDYGPLLTTIRECAPDAHIAGGAIRDTLLKRKIRDVDIFLNEDHTNEAASLLRSKFKYVKVGEWQKYEDFSDIAVARVAKFENADEQIPVCLIGLNKIVLHEHGRKGIVDNIGRFDFGICMAAWDGEKHTTTREFDSDRDNKTFTLCRADNQEQFAYSMVRYRKLAKERYAGWKLSIPPKFEELLKDHVLRRHWYQDEDNYYWAGDDGHYAMSQDDNNEMRPKAR